MIVGGGGRGGTGREKGEGENKGRSIRDWRRCERDTEGQEIKQKYIAPQLSYTFIQPLFCTPQ